MVFNFQDPYPTLSCVAVQLGTSPKAVREALILLKKPIRNNRMFRSDVVALYFELRNNGAIQDERDEVATNV